MYETKGNSPLFDCVEKSVMNLINYSATITIAINSSICEVLGWKLEKEESKIDGNIVFILGAIKIG